MNMDFRQAIPENPKADHKIWALYARLSRDDGDRSESMSIEHQKMKLMEYAKNQLGTSDFEFYIDDGWTGTNFDRPDFQRLKSDIEEKKIRGVVVKDLSRLGRDSPKASYYIQEYFPENKVRFIAIDDNVDKDYFDLDAGTDMMIDFKNLFNGLYPKDISKKVRSTFRTKQQAGQFIGAFACYGYKKDVADHNKIVVDEPAAEIVRRIFSLYLSGVGQQTIAKKLNEEGIPSPSAYKKMQGLNYTNGSVDENNAHWSYKSIHNILCNRIYTGFMVQNKTFRQLCKKKAIELPKEQWIVVPDTHEAIIDPDTFDRVQMLLSQNVRQTKANQNIHFFAGLFKCGDCGKAMTKITRKGVTTFSCGSYNRYGTNFCTAHYINEDVINQIVLNDLNAVIESLQSLESIVEAEEKAHSAKKSKRKEEAERLEKEAEKLRSKKKRAYEDYSEELISREDYLDYKERYDKQIQTLENQIDFLTGETSGNSQQTRDEWMKRLPEIGHIEELSREPVVEMVAQIQIYENHTIKIIYNFSDDLEDLISAS